MVFEGVLLFIDWVEFAFGVKLDSSLKEFDLVLENLESLVDTLGDQVVFEIVNFARDLV